MNSRNRNVVLLLLGMLAVTSAAVFTASPLPAAGSFALNASSDMSPILWGKDLSYHPLKQLTSTKPKDLGLQISAKFKNSYFEEFRLGSPPRSYFLMFGRTSAAQFIDAIYFDADADGVITDDEEVPCESYTNPPMADPKNAPYEFWYTRPVQRIRVPVTYTFSNGTTVMNDLTFTIEAYNVYSDSKTLLIGSDTCVVQTNLDTWFVGEITAGGRVLKAAVVDGNRDGLFNDAKNDYLLLDKNGDSRFDWGTERQALGKAFPGFDPVTGKKTKLTAAVAAWPVKLYLLPKGAAISPAELEAE